MALGDKYLKGPWTRGWSKRGFRAEIMGWDGVYLMSAPTRRLGRNMPP